MWVDIHGLRSIMAIRAGASIPEDWTRAAEVTVEHGLCKSPGVSGSPLEGGGGDRVAPLAKRTRAVKIYYFPYRLAARLADWPRHLERCRRMGFDSLAIPPPFATDDSGNPFLTADFDLPNPALGLRGNADVLDTIARLCREYGLNLIVDLVLDRVARGRFAATRCPYQKLYPAVSMMQAAERGDCGDSAESFELPMVRCIFA